MNRWKNRQKVNTIALQGACIAWILMAVMLLVPTVVGLADDGSFQAILEQQGLYAQDIYEDDASKRETSKEHEEEPLRGTKMQKEECPKNMRRNQ